MRHHVHLDRTPERPRAAGARLAAQRHTSTRRISDSPRRPTSCARPRTAMSTRCSRRRPRMAPRFGRAFPAQLHRPEPARAGPRPELIEALARQDRAGREDEARHRPLAAARQPGIPSTTASSRSRRSATASSVPSALPARGARTIDGAHGASAPSGTSTAIRCRPRQRHRRRGRRVARRVRARRPRRQTCEPGVHREWSRRSSRQGYEVKINDPYKGAEIVRRFADPPKRRHSLQIEINRRLYMDERTRERSPGFAKLQADLTELIRFLADYARSVGGVAPSNQ